MLNNIGHKFYTPFLSLVPGSLLFFFLLYFFYFEEQQCLVLIYNLIFLIFFFSLHSENLDAVKDIFCIELANRYIYRVDNWSVLLFDDAASS